MAAILLGPVSEDVLRAQSPDPQVEALSVYTDPSDTRSHRITVSFRVVNAGGEARSPFRIRVSSGPLLARGSENPDLVVGLSSGEAVYVSRTLTIPRWINELDVSVNPDVDGVAGRAATANNVALKHLVFVPPLPGQWVSVGPRNVVAPPVPGLTLGTYGASGRLAAIAIDPANPKTIYVGSPGELGHEGTGIWKTTNGGKSWQPLTDSFPTLAVAALAADPDAPGRVYAAMVDAGIFRSDDGGSSWKNVAAKDLHLRRNTGDGDRTVLLVDPVTPQVLYLTSDDGLLRSDDGGATWAVSLKVGAGTEPDGSATAVVMDPFDHLTLYAAIQGHGVYKTEDGGLTPWQLQSALPAVEVSPATGIRLALSRASAASPATVYALLGGFQSVGTKTYETHALFRTTNGGVSWLGRFRCTGVTDADCRGWVMASDPTNADTLYLAGPVLRISIDGGAHFARLPSEGKEDRQPYAPHGDYHGWAFQPGNPSIIFATTDGGVYRSTDHAKEGTWAFIGAGITNAEIYGLARARTPSERLIAATQDNGNLRYSGSPVWDHIQPVVGSFPQVCAGCGGDGGGVAIDAGNEDNLFVTGQDGKTVQDSFDGGATFADFLIQSPAKCFSYNQTFHLQSHPTQSGILLASCAALWLGLPAIPAGGTWNPVFVPSSGLAVRSAVDSGGNIYWVGGSDGNVYAGPGAANFQEVFTHPVSLPVSDLEVDAIRPQFLYASFANATVLDRKCAQTKGRIYQLRRQSGVPSASDTVATDITGNLPSGLCVNALAVDSGNRLTIYAATSKGVYRCRRHLVRQTSWAWESYNDGLPPADVRDLELDPATGRMAAGTYGRGAFEVRTRSLERLP